MNKDIGRGEERKIEEEERRKGEEEEEYEFRRMHALLQARQEPVTDRPFAVEHSARLHTHRYRLRPSWPRLRSSLTIEQLAQYACLLFITPRSFRAL